MNLSTRKSPRILGFEDLFPSVCVTARLFRLSGIQKSRAVDRIIIQIISHFFTLSDSRSYTLSVSRTGGQSFAQTVSQSVSQSAK